MTKKCKIQNTKCKSVVKFTIILTFDFYYMGSVKDLEVLEEPTKDKPGKARFLFSNRYSVFDWGEMPDLIPYKGEAIAILSSYFFERLEDMGISTHYLGLVENGRTKRLSSIKKPTNTMEIKLLRVLKPEFKNTNYDYSIYQREKGCFLIPLEVIYRNYLPEGSSIFRRLKEGTISLEDLGLDKKPYPNQRLDKPILDVSTKLEVTDRYLTWGEAQEISSLSNENIEKIKEITRGVNRLIREEFEKICLVNEDGKIEFGFDENRNFLLVDALGTLDECRFTHSGLPVSKEIARIYYRQTDWYNALESAKKKNGQNFKEICRLKPPHLPDKLKLLISQIYCSACNEITKKEWFDVPPLKEIIGGIRD